LSCIFVDNFKVHAFLYVAYIYLVIFSDANKIFNTYILGINKYVLCTFILINIVVLGGMGTYNLIQRHIQYMYCNIPPLDEPLWEQIVFWREIKKFLVAAVKSKNVQKKIFRFLTTFSQFLDTF